MKNYRWMWILGLSAVLTGCATAPKMAKSPAQGRHTMKAQLADFAILGGASLDEAGVKLVVPSDSLFKKGSSFLSKDGVQKVDALAATLSKYSADSVTVIVYTDNTGTDAKNLKISQHRADRIKRELVKQGISVDRVTVVGKGDVNPVAANDTDNGRSQNRRAEFDIASSQF